MGAHPFDLSYILEASGRWNRAGEYGRLYTATDRDTARREYEKYLERAGATGLARDHELVRMSVKVESVLALYPDASAGKIEIDHDFDREPV